MSVDLNKVKETLEEYGFSTSMLPLYFTSKIEDTMRGKDNFALRVDLPTKYEPIPEMPEVESSMFSKISDNDIICMYFQGIKMGSLTVKSINSIEPNLVAFGTKACNYCGTNIRKNNTIKNGCATLENNSYYYCFDCFKTMCPLCKSETNSVIAAKHKANLEKYEKRQPEILKCLQHNLKFIPAFVSTGECTCDVCSNNINLLSQNFMDGNSDFHVLGKMGTKWYYCRNSDIDVCMNCSETDKGKIVIEKHNLKAGYFRPICDYLNFGSIMDWIPIFVSQNTDYILYNANKSSPYFQRVAYCQNNNGFNIYVTGKEYSIIDSQDIMKTTARIQSSFDAKTTYHNFGLKMPTESIYKKFIGNGYQPSSNYTNPPFSSGNGNGNGNGGGLMSIANQINFYSGLGGLSYSN